MECDIEPPNDTPSYPDTDVSHDHYHYTLPDLRDKIVNQLLQYPFWAKLGSASSDDAHNDFAMRAITFWSENHVLMHLSSAYLFFNYMKTKRPNDKRFPTCHINKYFTYEYFEQMLKLYLEVHCHDDTSNFGEIYELNSVTYWKYTIHALLNLIDFAPDADIRRWSTNIMNSIVKFLMLLADPTHGIHCLGGKNLIYLFNNLNRHNVVST